MIQRVQSLLLLITAGLAVILMFVPVYELHNTVGQPGGSSDPQGVYIFSNESHQGNALLLIINSVIGALAFVTIFMFKWRGLQIRMCNLGLLLTCLMIGLLFFLADTMSSNMNQRVEYKFGSYIPLIQLVLLFVSGKFIRKDEDLVRSADRLR
ncbi:MAG: DUF4293 family protein [Bacteroidetes bacterium]|nr:MAG: DUF4293 family protein [Bacteroidota bacterium]REK08163.1 MAG: DUF4293 family protein [Bacteroidota bacterium]REK32368.1 MAG: DUF4293 family protein [Bacteroidota bacterium]REK49602.1 MAG: DUF4293 family protein [Bacteroidota bacterium]